jgi:hypothetical protein
LPSGFSYSFAITDASGVPVGYTVNGVTGLGDSAGASIPTAEWVQAPNGATYISGTSFDFFGDYTSTFLPGRRIRATITGGYVYGYVTSAVFGTPTAGQTRVTLSMTSGNMDATLGNIYYGFISPSPNSLPASIPNSNVNVSVLGGVAIGTALGGAISNPAYTGTDNIGIGTAALNITTNGFGNVAVGYHALLAVTTGYFNVGIGYGADVSAAGDFNSISIGYNVVGNGSNTITLGNSTHTDTYLKGRIRIPPYTTALAPAYAKGAVYFDTTLNKLRVGGATAWETVTSV